MPSFLHHQLWTRNGVERDPVPANENAKAVEAVTEPAEKIEAKTDEESHAAPLES